MYKRFLSIYKIPLLVSLTLSIILIALQVTREPLGIATIVLGTLLGTFMLDMEYVIYAYILEPERDFSKTLAAYIKDKDIANTFLFIHSHTDEIKDKTLNSAVFQIVLALFSIFAISASTSNFISALIISIFANSLYHLAEAYFENKIDDWFWALKIKPTRQQIIIYALVLLGIFSYCVSIF